VVNPVAVAVASLANSRKFLKFFTSRSVVLEVRTLPNPVASMAVEQLEDLRE
jgi:hypothetical protein